MYRFSEIKSVKKSERLEIGSCRSHFTLYPLLFTSKEVSG